MFDIMCISSSTRIWNEGTLNAYNKIQPIMRLKYSNILRTAIQKYKWKGPRHQPTYESNNTEIQNQSTQNMGLWLHCESQKMPL